MRHRVEVGRLGRVRDRMRATPDLVALHTLKELFDPRAKSLVADRNHGAWEGTGTTRGVPIDVICEGELGATFDGNGRIRVANDGAGFFLPGDGVARTLSLANGHADIFGFVKTTHNSATRRCLVHKQDGGSPTGNGFSVDTLNGQLRGFMKRSGSVIVDFARDLPLDDRWHVWQLHMSGINNRARLILDGIPMGVDETCSDEPPLTDGDYCIGGFSDLSGGFIGSLGLIGCGRFGDPDICRAIAACLHWTPITPDIRTDREPVETRHGHFDPSPTARIAPPATFTCVLDNSPENEFGLQGFYTPGHENALDGWKEGDPLTWTVIDDVDAEHVRFFGFVEDIDPEPGLARDQQVPILAESWLRRAMRTDVRQLPIQTNIRSDDAIRLLIDLVDRPPRAVDLDIGDSTFPVAFDDVSPGMKVYELLAKVVNNEGGHLYEQPDGTVVFESRTRRYMPTVPVAYWNDTNDSELLEDLQADRGKRRLVNVVPYTITPRRVGAVTTDVLASMPDRLFLPPGGAESIELHYNDPDNPSVTVGGTDVTVPEATTDYTATEHENGTGASLTAAVSVTAPSPEDVGGNSIKLRIENTGTLGAWVQVHQVRGRKLQKFDARRLEARSDDSVFEHDEASEPIIFDYQTNPDEAKAIVGQILALQSDPFMAPHVATRRGADDDMQQDIIERVIGEHVSIAESMTALDGSERTFIQGIELSVGSDGVFKADFAVSRNQAARSFWVLGEAGFSELGETTVLA